MTVGAIPPHEEDTMDDIANDMTCNPQDKNWTGTPTTEARDALPLGHANLGKAVESAPGQRLPGILRADQPWRSGERLSLDNIDDAMRYQPWNLSQVEAGNLVREILTLAAKTILRNVPDGAFRSVALRNILEARMNANVAISFCGRF